MSLLCQILSVKSKEIAILDKFGHVQINLVY